MRRMLLNASFALLMALAFLQLSAQPTNILQGTVKDGKGEPIIGASVGVKGSAIGTATDTAGRFTLAAPADAQTLTIKYIGYKTQDVAITAGADLNIVLVEDILGLDEVVVTAQAVKREQRSLGYSTTTVKSEELNRASANSALDALQGKVAGAQITNASGTPGGSTRVILRGGSSLAGDNNALIVVDGVPIDNSNFGFADVLNDQYDAGNRGNDINPQDIESVTVLKGAAAVALYGQRGANGVIIYTTKRGKDVAGNRKFKVSVNEDITVETPLKLPSNQNEFGQGLEDAATGIPYPDLRENSSWGEKFDGSIRPWGRPVDGQMRVKPYSALPNNIRSFFNLGATYNTNVSISGNDKGTDFYGSFNNVKYDGIVPTTGYQRNSLRLNFGHDFGNVLRVDASFNYTKTQGNLPIGGQLNQSPWFLLMNTPRDIPVQEYKDLNNPFNAPENFYDHYYPNPYWVLANEVTHTNVDRFLSNVNLEYKPTKWLTLTGRFGADVYTDTREQKWKKYGFVNTYYDDQGNPIIDSVSGLHTDPGRFSQDLYTVNNYNGDIMARFSNEFKKGIGLSVLIGCNIYHNQIKNTYSETAGLVIPDLYTLSNSQDRPTLTNDVFVKRLIGAYGDINLSYRNFVFVDFTARNDWSSTLPVNSRSYFYPGGSVSFVFTEIPKAKINPMIISYGKIRASVAQVGRDASPYQLKNYFVTGDINDGYLNTDIKSPYFSPANASIPGYQLNSTLANENLKPEISTTWEVGTELSFLKDRLSVDFTYYWKRTKNEIIIAPIAPSTGFTSQIINAGIFSNKGVELAVRIVPVSLKNGFKWEVFGTFTKNESKVVQIANNADQLVLGGTSVLGVVLQKGQPYGSFYGEDYLKDPQGHTVVDSASGMPILDKPKVLGNFSPKWLGSIGTTLSWKGLKFTILFDGRVGGQFYSATASLQQFLGTDPITTYNDRQPFVVPNSVYQAEDGSYHTNTTKVIPMNYWSNFVSANVPAYQLVSATFCKLREISLSYSLPAKTLQKTKYITGIEIKVYGSNLALWVPKSNTYGDPEINASGASNVQGFEYYNMPSLRNVGAGLKVDF